MKSNLKKLLLERKLSIRKFSKITKLDQSTISKVSNDKFEDITMKVFKIICVHLHCKFKDLVDTTELDEFVQKLIDNEKKTLTNLKVS